LVGLVSSLDNVAHGRARVRLFVALLVLKIGEVVHGFRADVVDQDIAVGDSDIADARDFDIGHDGGIEAPCCCGCG